MSSYTSQIQADQIASSLINQINNNRFNNFKEAISAVEKELSLKLAEQDKRLLESLLHLEKVREFVSNPNKILGSTLTKHGEIAEQVEVGIRNARDVLEGNDPIATFDAIGRLAPEDYIIGDIVYQSKYINGTNNTLRHVLEHMEKYENFRLGENAKYHIPSDQYEMIKSILNDENIDGYHSRTINSIKEKVSAIEKSTGQEFFNKVEPGDSSYSSIQIGKVDETLSNHEENLNVNNEKIKEEFNENSKQEMESLKHLKDPTLGEAAKSAAIGAAVSATMKFGMKVYSKYKHENKRIYEYDSEDWKEIGIDVSKSSIKGAISGGGIYALTNFGKMPAPVAGGYVSATISSAGLIKKYNNGEMAIEDLLIESEVVCVEAGMAMTCALVGQAMIPVPVVGAIVGSIVGSMIAGPIMNHSKKCLNEKEERLIYEYNKRYKDFSKKLKKDELRFYNEVMNQFNKFNNIEDLIFDNHLNTTLRLAKSVELADELGVEKSLILRNVDDVDRFFM